MKRILGTIFLINILSMLPGLDLPVNTTKYEIQPGTGMMSGFDEKENPLPALKTSKSFASKADIFVSSYLLRNDLLYNFIDSEFDHFVELTKKSYSDYSPPVTDLKNPGYGAKIFNEMFHLSLGYHKEENLIVLTDVFKEMGLAVGIIKDVDALETKFSVPLSIDGSQALFGSPNYYVVEKKKSKEHIVATVYDFSRSRVVFIFRNGFAAAVCFLN